MKYNVELQTITPLHIGNGETYGPLEYFIEEGYINIIDANSIFEDIEKTAKREGIEVIDELCKKMMSKITTRRIETDAKEFFAACGITNISKFVIGKLQTDIEPRKREKIHQFINQNGKYYIPGSSIKGAIRTAYLFNYLDNNENIKKLVEVLKDEDIKPDDKHKELNKRIFGEKIEDDIFKYIHVEDSHIIKDECIKVIETRRYNNRYPHQKGIPICLEAIKENITINFGIKIQDKSGWKIENIEDSIRNFTKVVCVYETKYIKNQFIKNFYNKILDCTKNSDELYMNVGFGGGYLSKTIYLLLWKYKEDINLIKRLLPTKKNMKTGIFQQVNAFEDFPRTRTVYNNEPIGWVKLRL